MNYQEFITVYPWVDIDLEMFKGIMPSVIALVAIFLTHFFTKKREILFKKKSMKIDYTEKILNWLHGIQDNVLESSFMLEKILSKREQNPIEKVNGYNKVTEITNTMQKSVAVWSNTYDIIAKSFGCDFKMEILRKSLDDYSDRLDYIYKKYFADDNESYTSEINDTIIIVNRNINESITILLKEFNK